MDNNLPPGCSSGDGGIDHDYEAAIETLCDRVRDANVLRELIKLIPMTEQAVWDVTACEACGGEGCVEDGEALGRDAAGTFVEGGYENCDACNGTGQRLGPPIQQDAEQN